MGSPCSCEGVRLPRAIVAARDADADVAHLESHSRARPAGFAQAARNADFTLLSELDRVVGETAEYLTQTTGIAEQRAGALGALSPVGALTRLALTRGA